MFSIANIQHVFSEYFIKLQLENNRQHLVQFFIECCEHVGKPIFLIDVDNSFNESVKQTFKHSPINIISDTTFVSPTGSIRNIIILQLTTLKNSNALDEYEDDE